MRVIAVIQARMGSTRFPGKVLRPLAGRPVLWHVVHRLRKCRTLSGVAVATSTAPGDDALALWCRAEGVRCVRGPEEDVLGRFLLAARELSADAVVRVTGDAPLVDPGTVDLLVTELVRQGADYACGEEGIPTIHEGFEPVTVAALARSAAEAEGDPAATEHVTAWIKANPARFRIARVGLPPAHRFEGARLSVDAPADLAFLEEVYRRLGAPPGEADVAEVVRLLRQDPSLLGINRSVRQKSARERTRRVLIRCDGNPTLGLGHVVRCLALGEELRERGGLGVTFAVASGPVAAGMVREAGFALEEKPPEEGEEEWVGRILAAVKPDALVLDVRTGLPRQAVRRWREGGVVVADLDDPEDKRLEADLAFYPPVPQVGEMDWSGFAGRLLAGWEWVVLRRQFSLGASPPREGAEGPPRILVSMGGADPARLTELAARALDRVEGEFLAVFVVGRAFPRRGELEAILAGVRYPFRILSDVPDMAALMTGCDLAVAAFGVTAYEMAAMGLPAVSLSMSPDHEQSASAFAGAGIAASLGDFRRVPPDALAAEVSSLLRDPERRKAMAERGMALVDGRGAQRVAEAIGMRMGGNLGP